MHVMSQKFYKNSNNTNPDVFMKSMQMTDTEIKLVYNLT